MLTAEQRQALQAQLAADTVTQIDGATAIMARDSWKQDLADMKAISTAIGTSTTVGQQLANLVSIKEQTPGILAFQRTQLAASAAAAPAPAAPAASSSTSTSGASTTATPAS